MTNCQGRHGGNLEARGLTFNFRTVDNHERAFCDWCGEMVRGIESPAAIEADRARMAQRTTVAELARFAKREGRPELTPRAAKASRARRPVRRMVLAA